MDNTEIIESDGRLFVSVDGLLAFLKRQRGDAYWLNGHQTLDRIQKEISNKQNIVIHSLVQSRQADTVNEINPSEAGRNGDS